MTRRVKKLSNCWQRVALIMLNMAHAAPRRVTVRTSFDASNLSMLMPVSCEIAISIAAPGM